MENIRVYPENFRERRICRNLEHPLPKNAAKDISLPVFKGNSTATDALILYNSTHSGGNFAVNPFVSNLLDTPYLNPNASIQKPINPQKSFLKTTEGKAMMSTLGILPPLRRDESVIDKVEQGNNLGAAFQVGIGLTNLPGDMREISRAGEEAGKIHKVLKENKGWNKIKNLKTVVDYKGQHEMTMLRGTFLEKLYNYFPALENLDKSLDSTKFGRFLATKFKVNPDLNNIKEINIKGFNLPYLKTKNHIVNAYNFEGNYLSKLAGKSLLRTSVLGVITTGILEAPALVNSITETKGSGFDKTKAFAGQLIKSAAYIGLVTAGISIAGAALGFTAIGSLVGMAIGSAVGIFASKEFNKIIDKIFKKPILKG